MRVLKSFYNPRMPGLSHDRLSRSAWRLSGLDPVARQRAAQERAAREIARHERRRAFTTAVLALAWAGLVAAVLRGF